MKFKQLFTEKRKLDIPKQSAVSIIKQYCEQYGYENIYFQYHNREKFGLNPNNAYDTPLGIYCYPAIAYKNEIEKEDLAVPFGQNRKFVNIFTPKTGKILNLSNYTQAMFDEDIKKLQKYSKKTDAYLKTVERLQNKSIGHKIWRIIKFLSTQNDSTATNFKTFTYKKPEEAGGHGKPVYFKTMRSTVLFSTILRKLGYIGVIDLGEGIIYSIEPTQGIFFSTSDVKLLDRINNIKVVDSDDKKIEDLMNNLSSYGIMKLTYDKKNKDLLKTHWFIQAIIHNKIHVYKANVDVNLMSNTILWRNGVWLDGTWENGLWKNGKWMDGTWITGIWYAGLWEQGYDSTGNKKTVPPCDW